MSVLPPRAVLVTRPTAYQELIARHGTRGQTAFFLDGLGQNLEEIEAQHRAQTQAVSVVRDAIPDDWRRIEITRRDLDRFLFAPSDIVIAIGQDGLIANLAKYAHGLPVIGINPLPGTIAGLLVQHAPSAAAQLLPRAAAEDVPVESRAMVEAQLGHAGRLLALNEVFVGHASHQSARYRISQGRTEARHSSSGVIISTGTGSTGWARSIAQATKSNLKLTPQDDHLAFFVREPWPSPSTSTALSAGLLARGRSLAIRSEMNEGGVIFADGIEADRLSFDWGMEVRLAVAAETLRLVVRD